MSRKIKVRVWLKLLGRFTTKDEWWLDLNGNLHFLEIIDGNDTLNAVPDDYYVVQQFTGLLDKNGKEIYEGDIVEYGGSLMYEIIWNDLTMGFVASTITSQDGMYQLTTGQLKNEANIIGNIFQNPELVK